MNITNQTTELERYGPSVLHYYEMTADQQEESTMSNPMCETFPRIAACQYIRYGSGGSQSRIEAICILGMNMINDKVCTSDSKTYPTSYN